MKYLGKIGKLGVFFSAFVLVFLFSDKTVLAVKTGDSCTVSGYTGTCRVYSEGCNSGEKKVGVGTCESGGTAYVCCVTTNDDISSTDDECKKANGLCESSLPCSDNRQEKGYCTTSIIGVIKSCCTDPKTSSTSTGSGTPSSSGTASLKYTPLENLPGFEDQGGDFATYFGNLYKLALWIVGISALFMLVVGGFLYLSSAGNTALLGTAKKTIYSALIGLVIALVSWLLLDTINSDLTNLKLSGLSGAISSGSSSGTTGGTSGSSSTPTEYKGKGSGCSGAETQGAKVHCEDASQDLSDTLYCMVDKLKASGKKIQISSISEDSGGKSLFTQCRDNWTQPPCEHGKGSCHYGGSVKNDKSCAADISGSYINGGGSAASASEVKDVAGKCGAQINDEMGKSSGAHIHVSVKGCGCL